ncbi:MAG TPA: hypothetical protein VM261_32000 [Kofleriaceae bacterium]|nr:hypothetical protein [Kofleriaceae bacterium]
MWIPDGAPPLALYCAPYGGLGLKTKSFAAALARIEGLLASSTSVAQQEAELTVWEPAGQALVEWVAGPLEHGIAGSSGAARTLDDPAALLAKHGHVHDALAAEAWQLFGPPTHIGRRMQRGGPYHVSWEWRVTDPVRAPQQLAMWTPFATANDKGMLDDYSTLVQVRAIWEARLVVAGGRAVPIEYPPSRIHAHLRGKHASAFLDLVLPHDAATDAFLADYQAVNKALGITVPMKGWKLNAPKKKGGGRALKKLPGL